MACLGSIIVSPGLVMQAYFTWWLIYLYDCFYYTTVITSPFEVTTQINPCFLTLTCFLLWLVWRQVSVSSRFSWSCNVIGHSSPREGWVKGWDNYNSHGGALRCHAVASKHSVQRCCHYPHHHHSSYTAPETTMGRVNICHYYTPCVLLD